MFLSKGKQLENEHISCLVMSIFRILYNVFWELMEFPNWYSVFFQVMEMVMKDKKLTIT